MNAFTPPHALSSAEDGNGFALQVDAGLDSFERDVLHIARLFFSTYDMPVTQRWSQAFLEAELRFPMPFGATIAHAIAIAVEAMRGPRKRPFAYFDVEHPKSQDILTQEERYLLLTLAGIRRKDTAQARMHAMLACEGGDSSALLAALERLAMITGDVDVPSFN